MENDSIWDQEVSLEEIRQQEEAMKARRESRRDGDDIEEFFTDDSNAFIEDDASAEDIAELVELEEAEND